MILAVSFTMISHTCRHTGECYADCTGSNCTTGECREAATDHPGGDCCWVFLWQPRTCRCGESGRCERWEWVGGWVKEVQGGDIWCAKWYHFFKVCIFPFLPYPPPPPLLLSILLLSIPLPPLAAISSSSHSIQGAIACGTQYHFHMETHSSLCIPEDDGLSLVSSTQWTALTQAAVSNVLGIPTSRWLQHSIMTAIFSPYMHDVKL